MAAHRYWRLLVSKIGGSSYVAIGELIMAATAGGAQVATGGTASASSVTGSNSASAAFDGTTSSSNAWQSGANYNGTTSLGVEWIQYDFGGSPQDLVELRIYFPATGTFGSTTYPSNMTLSYSDDGKVWTLRTAWQGITFSQGQTQTFTVADLNGTNRVVLDKRYRWNGMALAQGSMLYSATRGIGLSKARSFTRPYNKNPYTGAKRIHGSTTSLTLPVPRRVMLYANDGNLVAKVDTKADGVYDFTEIAAGQYTLLGVDLTQQQNDPVYAFVTAVD